MPSFEKLTTKAKSVLQRSHELAMERGQDHVNVAHLLTALVLQDESPVVSVLERMEVDLIKLSETLLEAIETGEQASAGSQSQMIQMFIAPDLAQVLERSVQIAASLKDEFISVEHLFLGCLALPHAIRPELDAMHVTYDRVLKALNEIKSDIGNGPQPKKQFRALAKYSRNLTKLAREDKLDPVIGRDKEIMSVI